MNRRNKIKNPRKPPQWSEATKKKRDDYKEANKEKFAKREAQSALYKKYKRLKTKKSKRAFNRKYGRYGSGKTKKPRWNDEEIGSWKQEKTRSIQIRKGTERIPQRENSS